ncbi:endonuclease/exonuclease/phosphatase family protein [Flavobacterium selenitireducens]|uniref:endonuclease/exonuclease/phosphatase family protein n=1 Tax=Flavobacterium selenitireducens TaxID=2722704 RepID=UPI00168C088D|nr:endonuclease/exonuclease/phosphatase family protein [Flavobacterium selenitireducens]MBD3582037.1 endonuclease/exonuclease/phosphatase family protein [Flavobacterium selenitireducens]
MTIKRLIAVFFVFFAITTAKAQAKQYKMHTVAFYNVENLFDTIKGTNNDEEYLPSRGWTSKKYKKKLDNLGRVIPNIGTNEQQKESPAIIGVSEIENRRVLEDLVKNYQMVGKDYGVVHFDSPDKRGIDVGFLYQKKYFKPTSYKNIPLLIMRDGSALAKNDKADKEDDDAEAAGPDNRLYTRDQLLVTGLLEGEEIHVIVNHWPSRSGGEKKSSPGREAAGRLNRRIIDSLVKINPNAKIITMGDLNDGPYNKSVKQGIGAKLKKTELKQGDMYNPFEQMQKNGEATLFYRDAGDIFDQIIVSEGLAGEKATGWKYWKAGIYNKSFLIQTSGQYKGYPLRNSPSEPGYSDHFPVYVYLIKEVK